MGEKPKRRKTQRRNTVRRKSARRKTERRWKVLYIVLCLVALAALAILGAHTLWGGPGSRFWDLAVTFFATFSAMMLASGVIFPILAFCAVIAFPLVLLALYLRNR